MTNQTIRDAVWDIVESSGITPEELVVLLEIEVQDLLKKFPRKVVEHAEKFGVYQEETEGPVETEEAEFSGRNSGFSVTDKP